MIERIAISVLSLCAVAVIIMLCTKGFEVKIRDWRTFERGIGFVDNTTIHFGVAGWTDTVRVIIKDTVFKPVWTLDTDKIGKGMDWKKKK